MTGVSFYNVLAVQFRIIFALVLRETRASFGTSQFGYLWAIVTPAAGIGLLVFIFSLAGRAPAFGSSMALFFATGILTLSLFTNLSNKLMNAFKANKALLNYPLIKETDLLIARQILISLTYLLINLLFYGALILLDLAKLPVHPDQVLQAFLATAFLGFGFGTCNAVIFSLWETWANIEKILTRPLFFLSAIFYVPSRLGPEAISFLKWNPVLHLVEWFRTGYYANYNSTVLNVHYPLALGLILTLFGLAGERLFRKARLAK